MAIERISQRLTSLSQARKVFTDVWNVVCAEIDAGRWLYLELKSDTRSLASNAMMWSCLTDISKQIVWHDNKLSPEEWKDVLSAALKKQKIVPGIEGGIVMLGSRTSKMTRKEMTEMIETCHFFGDQNQVQWSKTSLGSGWPDEVFQGKSHD
jgi:hypothetical protein